MPRYIAGIWREARKYAGFEGFFVLNATEPLSPENQPSPEVRRRQLPATAGRCCDRQKRKPEKVAAQAAKKFGMNRIAANGQFPLILPRQRLGVTARPLKLANSMRERSPIGI
jgi:hypothetical protein